MTKEKDSEKINKMYRQLDERKRLYGIVDFEPLKSQEGLCKAVAEKNPDRSNKYRFLLYQG